MNFLFLKFFLLILILVRLNISRKCFGGLLGLAPLSTNGFAHGSPGHAGSNDISHDHQGGMLDCFSSYIDIYNSFFAEIFAVILALEMAKDKGWLNLWIEYDFAFVIQAFSNPSIVPCKLHKRWEACQFFCKNIVLVLSHIYREGNFCVDKLANVGALSRDFFNWWNLIPVFVRKELLRNRLSLSNYRFRQVVVGFDIIPPTFFILFFLIPI